MQWIIQTYLPSDESADTDGWVNGRKAYPVEETCQEEVNRLNLLGEKSHRVWPVDVPQWLQVPGAKFRAVVIIKDDSEPDYPERYQLCALEQIDSPPILCQGDIIVPLGGMFTVDGFDFTEFLGAGIDFELYEDGGFYVEEIEPIYADETEPETGLEMAMPLIHRTISNEDMAQALQDIGGSEGPYVMVDNFEVEQPLDEIVMESPDLFPGLTSNLEKEQKDRESDFPITATHTRVEMTEPEDVSDEH